MCIADPFGCFLHLNPAFVSLTGYTERELVSHPFVDFVHPEDRQRTIGEMKRQVALGPSIGFENRYICRDGRVVHLSWYAYFDEQDRMTHATARDVTLSRKTLRASSKPDPNAICSAATRTTQPGGL